MSSYYGHSQEFDAADVQVLYMGYRFNSAISKGNNPTSYSQHGSSMNLLQECNAYGASE